MSSMNYETSFGIIVLPSLIIWCCGSYSLLKLVRVSHQERSDKVLHLPVATEENGITASNRRIAIRGADIIAVIYETAHEQQAD